MGLVPPTHCVSRSWSRGKCELEFGMWMNVPVSFESFLAVVLPRHQQKVGVFVSLMVWKSQVAVFLGTSQCAAPCVCWLGNRTDL